jgi:hypothetical protein
MNKIKYVSAFLEFSPGNLDHLLSHELPVAKLQRNIWDGQAKGGHSILKFLNYNIQA